MFSFTVPADFPAMALKDLLLRQKVSLTLRRKLKKDSGALAINGQPAAWPDRVHPGDTVTIRWPEECSITPVPMPLALVYEDESLLVADKPAGLLVHPASGAGDRPSLAGGVIHYLRTRGENSGFHPVHRLDRNTSGLVLIAKNPYIQHLFSGGGGVALTRHYRAVVRGALTPPAGVVDAPIGRRQGSIIQRIVRPDGQKAVTLYETEAVSPRASLVSVRILTGRTHQIRVHLAHTGHPVWGDDLYGGPREGINRQALHAARLSFTHPLTGKELAFDSPLPPDILALLEILRF